MFQEKHLFSPSTYPHRPHPTRFLLQISQLQPLGHSRVPLEYSALSSWSEILVQTHPVCFRLRLGQKLRARRRKNPGQWPEQ